MMRRQLFILGLAGRKIARRPWGAAVVALAAANGVLAIDPPHDGDCAKCHMTHNAPGLGLASAAGNGNLCMSCHVSGGVASAKPFASSQQALPWPGLPGGIAPTGTSHRWDSGAAGHAQFLGGAAASSTGTLTPLGTFTGAYSKTYTITITTAGNVGAARFSWTATTPGGGSGANVLSGTNVPLDQGISVKFLNGSGTSFQVNDKWNLYVRADLRHPTNTAMLARLDNGRVTCSTCHDEHSQAKTPFDAQAPGYAGAGTGEGRHFMRADNNLEQMCVDCHGLRQVTNSTSGSHPVGLAYTPATHYKTTTNLPLEKVTGKIRCLTCHKIHHAPSNDGTLLAMANGTDVCVECHTLADRATPGAHFVSTDGRTLWPGGQYGSSFPPRTAAGDRGGCMNCHNPHGWPNTTNTVAHYPKLLVDHADNLCFTCHDADGPALKNVRDDFAKARRHPIGESDPLRRPGRLVECGDCHDPHRAQAGAHVYNTTATASRNRISNPNRGVSGVSVNYAGLGNFVAPDASRYTVIPETVGVTYQYELCFKCHTAYSFGSTPPAGITPVYGTGTASFANNSATVIGSGTSWRSGMVGLWIFRNNNPGAAYRITAVASTTNLTIAPPYSGASASAQTYTISGETDLAQEFSPMNRSGHPVVTGLDNYPNSTAVGSPARKGLQPSALKAPWNVNVGQQTMLCTDCHSTDAGSAAAQGPHGSAAQFMLRGNNAGNWPNVQNSSFGTSWCANCHNDNVPIHTDHHNGNRCYECHIVIPHGGKLSRLIADHDTMPARYAYNGALDTRYMQGINKVAAGSYREGDCRAQCTGKHRSTTPSENW